MCCVMECILYVQIWDFNGHCYHTLHCGQDGQPADVGHILSLKRSLIVVGWARYAPHLFVLCASGNSYNLHRSWFLHLLLIFTKESLLKSCLCLHGKWNSHAFWNLSLLTTNSDFIWPLFMLTLQVHHIIPWAELPGLPRGSVWLEGRPGAPGWHPVPGLLRTQHSGLWILWWRNRHMEQQLRAGLQAPHPALPKDDDSAENICHHQGGELKTCYLIIHEYRYNFKLYVREKLSCITQPATFFSFCTCCFLFRSYAFLAIDMCLFLGTVCVYRTPRCLREALTVTATQWSGPALAQSPARLHASALGLMMSRWVWQALGSTSYLNCLPANKNK